MNVGFYVADQNPRRDRTLGITIYSKNLISEMKARPGLQLSAVASKSSFYPDGGSISVKTLPMRTDDSLRRLVIDQLHPLFSLPEVDLWHYPKGFLPLFFSPRGPIVGTVCDVILQFYADRYPHARSSAAYSYWLGMLKRSIPRFAMVLTISEFSKIQIQQFCHRHKLRPPHIAVTYLARQWNREEVSDPEKQDYVLHLASKEPHKRTETLLKFWSSLESKRTLPELRLVGGLNDESIRLCQRLNRVRLFPRLPEADLKRLFAKARALIIPSEIEGFGLPALEAYELRTPVVFAAGTPIREILGSETPGEFSLTSLDSFEFALETVLTLDQAEVARKAADLRQRFSWSRCADETISIYNRLN